MGLHDSLASGFTQYAVVYVLHPAEQVKYEDFDQYERGRDRGRKLLHRARAYGLGGLELRHEGLRDALLAGSLDGLSDATDEDISLLYWTGAAWLASISLSKEDMDAIGELPVAAGLVFRAHELDPEWDRGALHDLLISVEPVMPMPGGQDRAREHFERAVALCDGTRASPYLSLANAVSVVNQDRDEFVSLMEKALAIDVDAYPNDRLANVYAQEQARFLLDHIDDLFL